MKKITAFIFLFISFVFADLDIELEKKKLELEFKKLELEKEKLQLENNLENQTELEANNNVTYLAIEKKKKKFFIGLGLGSTSFKLDSNVNWNNNYSILEDSLMSGEFIFGIESENYRFAFSGGETSNKNEVNDLTVTQSIAKYLFSADYILKYNKAYIFGGLMLGQGSFGFTFNFSDEETSSYDDGAGFTDKALGFGFRVGVGTQLGENWELGLKYQILFIDLKSEVNSGSQKYTMSQKDFETINLYILYRF